MELYLLMTAKQLTGKQMAATLNNHVFKGHKTLFGVKSVTYGEVELPTYYDKFEVSKNFDWGFLGSASLQLSFAILYKISKDEEFATNYARQFSQEVVKYFGKDWVLQAKEVQQWIEKNAPSSLPKTQVKAVNKTNVKVEHPNRTKKRGASKDNIVKQLCKEIGITQKELAKVLEVPEGTVSSWAVKNEIPRLGKKAIEFYIENRKKEEIIQSYKSFVDLLQNQTA